MILPAIDCIFCDLNQTFICLSKNSIRIYSAKNGALISFFNLINQEITCMAINHKQRKLFLGDTSGNIKVYNALTCVEIA